MFCACESVSGSKKRKRHDKNSSKTNDHRRGRTCNLLITNYVIPLGNTRIVVRRDAISPGGHDRHSSSESYVHTVYQMLTSLLFSWEFTLSARLECMNNQREAGIQASSRKSTEDQTLVCIWPLDGFWPRLFNINPERAG